MKAFIDFGAVWVTIVWFAILIAWPGAVAAAVCGWSASSFALRRRSRRTSLVSGMVAAAVLIDGFIVFLEFDQALLAFLPSQSRPLAQFVVITLPWLALLVGAVLLALALWHSRVASSNRAPQTDAREAEHFGLPSQSRAAGRER